MGFENKGFERGSIVRHIEQQAIPASFPTPSPFYATNERNSRCEADVPDSAPNAMAFPAHVEPSITHMRPHIEYFPVLPFPGGSTGDR